MQSTRRRRAAAARGFTLMEVLLVLVILVILGSLAVGVFTNAQKKAQMDAARSQIGLLKTPTGLPRGTEKNALSCRTLRE